MSGPPHNFSAFNSKTFERSLLVKNVIKDALVARHEMFRVTEPAWHRPFQPRCKIIPGEQTSSPEPLSGVEYELRRACARINIAHSLPIIVEDFGVSLGLLLIVYKKGDLTL